MVHITGVTDDGRVEGHFIEDCDPVAPGCDVDRCYEISDDGKVIAEIERPLGGDAMSKNEPAALPEGMLNARDVACQCCTAIFPSCIVGDNETEHARVCNVVTRAIEARDLQWSEECDRLRAGIAAADRGNADLAERLRVQREEETRLCARVAQLEADIAAEQNGRLALRKAFGARDDETMWAFVRRLALFGGEVAAPAQRESGPAGDAMPIRGGIIGYAPQSPIGYAPPGVIAAADYEPVKVTPLGNARELLRNVCATPHEQEDPPQAPPDLVGGFGGVPTCAMPTSAASTTPSTASPAIGSRWRQRHTARAGTVTMVDDGIVHFARDIPRGVTLGISVEDWARIMEPIK